MFGYLLPDISTILLLDLSLTLRFFQLVRYCEIFCSSIFCHFDCYTFFYIELV